MKEAEVMFERTADEILTLRGMFPKHIPFAVLVAPTRLEIRDRDSGDRAFREGMIAALAKRSIPAIDLHAPLAEQGFESVYFIHDGHWQPRGHEIAGKKAAAWLRPRLQGNRS